MLGQGWRECLSGVREVPGLRSQWAVSPGGHPRALGLRPSVLPAVDMLEQVGALGKASAHRGLGALVGAAGGPEALPSSPDP